ncbi:hypothetical protein REH81_32175, partial [Vibrio rotiferianus]
PYQLLILAAGNSDIVSNNPVDLGSLNNLASATGGRLVEVTVDNSDIEKLNRFVERNMQLNGESSMPWKDMGYQLSFPIALIMMLWFRKGWLVQWCVVAMPVTQDSKVFEPFLAAITPEIMPVEGKLAETALPLIDRQLQDQPGSTVLLVTDGVNPATITAYKNYFADKAGKVENIQHIIGKKPVLAIG